MKKFICFSYAHSRCSTHLVEFIVMHDRENMYLNHEAIRNKSLPFKLQWVWPIKCTAESAASVSNSQHSETALHVLRSAVTALGNGRLWNCSFASGYRQALCSCLRALSTESAYFWKITIVFTFKIWQPSLLGMGWWNWFWNQAEQVAVRHCGSRKCHRTAPFKWLISWGELHVNLNDRLSSQRHSPPALCLSWWPAASL